MEKDRAVFGKERVDVPGDFRAQRSLGIGIWISIDHVHTFLHFRPHLQEKLIPVHPLDSADTRSTDISD
ncbi:MAG: hypothetical protein GY696_27260 [Gammaproteobacteria bacterium]|nr:hypothetical protein [Gammaproteobacteria bacterium]